MDTVCVGCAIDCGEDMYTDPATGYMVFTGAVPACAAESPTHSQSSAASWREEPRLSAAAKGR
eukprot:3907167-Rhodomonas_salina.1